MKCRFSCGLSAYNAVAISDCKLVLALGLSAAKPQQHNSAALTTQRSIPLAAPLHTLSRAMSDQDTLIGHYIHASLYQYNNEAFQDVNTRLRQAALEAGISGEHIRLHYQHRLDLFILDCSAAYGPQLDAILTEVLLATKPQEDEDGDNPQQPRVSEIVVSNVAELIRTGWQS